MLRGAKQKNSKQNKEERGKKMFDCQVGQELLMERNTDMMMHQQAMMSREQAYIQMLQMLRDEEEIRKREEEYFRD